MRPAERQRWIENRLREGGPYAAANVLDAELVFSYVEATGADCDLMPFGAPRCRQLGRDLAALFAAGRLTRSTVGLAAGDAAMGFPKWVYSYRLASAS